jgi:hypothetical protein
VLDLTLLSIPLGVIDPQGRPGSLVGSSSAIGEGLV